jgi:hypothetical protein
MLRIGIVGLDSSHAVEFTRLLNAETSPWDAGVVVACPGSPTDFPLSCRRAADLERQVREQGIPFAPSADAVAGEVDAWMLLTCDGRAHRREALPLLATRKPLFIDKPLSADWREGRAILRAAQARGTPCFSASALRFRPMPVEARSPALRPLVVHMDVPRAAEPGHPELAWHGIHGVEAGYALLGAGCRTVTRAVGADRDVTIGRWQDGSQLVVARTDKASGRAFRLQTVLHGESVSAIGHDYRPLLAEVVRFFQTGAAPVATDEMIEVLAFLAAADASRAEGGRDIDLAALLASS